MNYVIQGWYASSIGWEDLTSCETPEEAREELHTYRVNEPQFAHRIETRRN